MISILSMGNAADNISDGELTTRTATLDGALATLARLQRTGEVEWRVEEQGWENGVPPEEPNYED